MVADRSLLEVALKTGLAVGKVYDKVVIGSDTRTSSEGVKHAFMSGLLAAGARCWDCGTIPTPTLALAAREFQVGAMITASHNPPEYNGIKLLNSDGSAFNENQRRQIEEMLSDNALSTASWEKMTGSRFHDGAIEQHIEDIKKELPHGLKMKVVLDCACGAASVITPYLLRQLGCEVVALNCYPSGFFPHDVEPTEANLSDLIKATREFGADLGIAHDGDADRMMAVDDQGRFIPGDKLLILFAQQLGAKKVVTTLDASMVIEESGFKVTRTKVGDIYVSEELKKGGDFGGEPSGAWVFPGNSFCPDGIYAASRLVAIASRHKLSSLVDRIPQYPILRGSIDADGISSSNLEERLMALKPVSVNNIDGTRLGFEDGWLLIRPSGTEPKIRVTAEARSETRAHQLFDSCLNILKKQPAGKEK